MKILIVLLITLIFSVQNFKGQVILSESLNGISQSDQAYFIEDRTEELSVNDLIEGKSSDDFTKFKYKEESLPFTASTYWLKFDVVNELGRDSKVILEVARPITNLVEFFLVRDKKVVLHNKCGDDVPFGDRMIEHRKNLFPFKLSKEEKVNLFVKLKSDGELIFLPIKLYTPKTFYESDSKNQLFQGIYFGVLAVVVFIFFFFYYFLRERTFLFYVLYVSSIFLMQFSLEGFSYQFIFPDSPYFANHIILFSASTTILFVMYYAYLFLNLGKYDYNLKKVYKAFMYASFLIAVLGLIPGPLYSYGYPIINVVGLFGVSTIVFSIFYLIFKGHKVSRFFTIAFVILIAGAIVFILTDLHIIKNPYLGENSLKLSSGIEALILSISMASRYRDLSSEKEKAQMDKMRVMLEKKELVDQQKAILEKEVQEQTRELNIERALLEEKNKELTDSINYAKRLQDALIPPKENLKECFEENFIFFLPKDIVSGDFYWFAQVTTTDDNPTKMSVISVADCTGHGVPGAFMSIIGIKLFNESMKNEKVNSPAEALDFLNEQVFTTVNKHAKNELIRDGMDLSLIGVSEKSKKVYYSGANNPIYIIPKNANSIDELIELKADKFPIGNNISGQAFTNKEYAYQKGDLVYLFSDGYVDQFGGPKNKKFKSWQFKELLFSIKDLSMQEQHEIIQDRFLDWKGNRSQIDDVCVLGIRL